MGKQLLILGGGIAGLAAGWAAANQDRSFVVLEAEPLPGGLCTTFEHEGFRFDSGAHRIHDKDPETTAALAELLGGNLHVVDRPSAIFDGARFVRFPLAALDVGRHLGLRNCARAARDVITARLRRPSGTDSFEEHAVRMYGRFIADRYLLNYSQKLWGESCAGLAPEVSGDRMKGMDLREALVGRFRPRRGSARHVEGRFLYPRGGIAAIIDALESACRGGLRTGARVTRLRHDGGRIVAVEVNGDSELEAGSVISTIRLDQLATLLDPPLPILAEHARHLHYRSLVLVALFLDVPSIMPFATAYFPTTEFPFTRIFEPRNRCPTMAPPGQTSLVAEIPCMRGDAAWEEPQDRIAERVLTFLERLDWLPRECALLGTSVRRIRDAYPVLSLNSVAHADALHKQLAPFTNLRLVGRNGRFEYSWIHGIVRTAGEAVGSLATVAAAAAPAGRRGSRKPRA